jgi:hypothetical protein
MPISTARRQVTVALQGFELPDCFTRATVSAAVNTLDRSTKTAKASRRRLVAKGGEDRGGAVVSTEPYRVIWGACLSETFATFDEALPLYRDLEGSYPVSMQNDDRCDDGDSGLTAEEREALS